MRVASDQLMWLDVVDDANSYNWCCCCCCCCCCCGWCLLLVVSSVVVCGMKSWCVFCQWLQLCVGAVMNSFMNLFVGDRRCGVLLLCRNLVGCCESVVFVVCCCMF